MQVINESIPKHHEKSFLHTNIESDLLQPGENAGSGLSGQYCGTKYKDQMQFSKNCRLYKD